MPAKPEDGGGEADCWRVVGSGGGLDFERREDGGGLLSVDFKEEVRTGCLPSDLEVFEF